MKLHFVAGSLDFDDGTKVLAVLIFEHGVDYNDPRRAISCIVVDDHEDAIFDRINERRNPGEILSIKTLKAWFKDGTAAWQAHSEAGNLIVDPEDLENVII